MSDQKQEVDQYTGGEETAQQEDDRQPANPKARHSSKQSVQESHHSQQQQQLHQYDGETATDRGDEFTSTATAAAPISEGIVVIEVCEKCHEHAWCTQHDEQKYNAIYAAVKAQLEVHPNGSLQVFRNVNPKNIKQKIIPRRGAFEIILDGVVVYSKITSTLFPAPAVINDRVTKFLEDKNGGGDLSKYATTTEKKQEPPKKPRDKAQIYGKYYVAIQEEQQRQNQLREQQELHRQEQERQEAEKKEREEEERLQAEEQARLDEEERIRQQEEEEERQRLEQERLLHEQQAHEEQLRREEEENHQHQLELQLQQEQEKKEAAEQAQTHQK